MAVDTMIVDLQTPPDRELTEQVSIEAEPSSTASRAPLQSEDDLALEFSRRYADRLIYIAKFDRWYIYTGAVWQHDDRREVFDLARQVCRDALQDALADTPAITPALKRDLRRRYGAAAIIWNVVRLAGTDPRHARTPDQLDADPWLLNTPGGIIDLRTGAIGPHDAARLCTKITTIPPGGECPAWQEVLAKVLPDPQVRDYVQRLAGYGLVGSAREHVAPFAFGLGANGKTTVFGTIRRIMGSYALDVAAELLTESHNDRHPCELAVLHGARLVIGSEIDTGKRWNEARLKRLTGGDRISARFIARDPFDFEPSHTLVIIANTKPSFRTVDEATRRRVHLIPFNVQIPEAERDPKLPERLDADAGGILRWALDGCLAWQREGLSPPDVIRNASAAYLDAEDSIGAWLAERCDPHGQLKLTAAHRDYRNWCDQTGYPALGRNGFADQLEAHDVSRTTDRKGTVIFSGLSISGSTVDRRSADDF
jgi:putative DNA primase/helicase